MTPLRATRPPSGDDGGVAGEPAATAAIVGFEHRGPPVGWCPDGAVELPGEVRSAEGAAVRSHREVNFRRQRVGERHPGERRAGGPDVAVHVDASVVADRRVQLVDAALGRRRAEVVAEALDECATRLGGVPSEWTLVSSEMSACEPPSESALISESAYYGDATLGRVAAVHLQPGLPLVVGETNVTVGEQAATLIAVPGSEGADGEAEAYFLVIPGLGGVATVQSWGLTRAEVLEIGEQTHRAVNGGAEALPPSLIDLRNVGTGTAVSPDIGQTPVARWEFLDETGRTVTVAAFEAKALISPSGVSMVLGWAFPAVDEGSGVITGFERAGDGPFGPGDLAGRMAGDGLFVQADVASLEELASLTAVRGGG